MKRLLALAAFLMPLLVVAPAAPLLSGCKLTPGCIIEDKVTQVISKALVNGLNCQNASAVYQDVLNSLEFMGLCDENHPKPMGSVCVVLAEVAVNQLTKLIPKKWDCDPAAATMGLKAAVSAACSTVLPW